MTVSPVVPHRSVATSIAALRHARSWFELANVLTPMALALFDSDLGCASLDGQGRVEMTPKGRVDASFAEHYDRHWRTHDPIVRAALCTHEPYDNSAAFESRRWHEEPMFGAICAPSGLHHYMVVPLVGCGRVIGTVSLSRRKERRGFDDADRVKAGVMAGHASALLAEMKRLATPSVTLAALTSAERRTAELAAEGYTVDGIALLRSVSRNTVKDALRSVYRKLSVSSRVELAIRLR